MSSCSSAVDLRRSRAESLRQLPKALTSATRQVPMTDARCSRHRRKILFDTIAAPHIAQAFRSTSGL